LGEVKDLEDSILNLQQAVQLTDNGNPNKPKYHGSLGLSQQGCFKRFGNLTDIENSILNLQKAVQLTRDGHPDKPAYLGALGASQQGRFERLGDLTDIKDSIMNLQQAVYFTQDGHPDKAIYLGTLGASQLKKYDHLGELKDIEDSILHLKQAVQLKKDGHPNKPVDLCNLGLSQRSHFEHLGNLTDVEDSILNLHKAVQLTNDGHPNQPMYLGNLGGSQLKRYERLGEMNDVENSILNLQKAVQLTEDGHPNKPMYLASLGISQQGRFNRLGNLADIENSISNLQKAVHFIKDGHPSKPLYLGSLGGSQRSYFDQLGNVADIQDSIMNLQKAVQLTEDRHPNKPVYFSTLSHSQLSRFQLLGELTDLEDGISNLQQAIHLIDHELPDKAKYLFTLGMAKQLRFEHLNKPEDSLASISALQSAAQSKTAYPYDSLSAARAWATVSHHNGDLPSALDGYRTALEILPKVAWLGLNSTSRQNWLIQERSEDLSCLSATCAIQLGQFEEAVELLDLGRSVFWQQASSLRSDLEKLREAEPELANQLETVGKKLNAGNFSGLLFENAEQHVKVHGAENVGKERRHLVNEWEGLVDRVRQLSQFEHFLRPVLFCQLHQAVTKGQVVIINASEYGVDALIFDASCPIMHVSLPEANIETLSGLAGDILLHQPINASESQQGSYNSRYLKPALRTIWNDILIPIFDKMGLCLNSNLDGPQCHIWWYPTGPLTFIPIHAAGPGKGQVDTSHLVISSYVTTLSQFFKAKQKYTPTIMRQSKFLAISQSDTPGQKSLPLSTKEADKVIQMVSWAGWPTEDIVHLSGSDATVDRVSGELGLSSWVHLACHGMQHPILGMNSAFALHDGDLELSQIASQKLSSGCFAFLSACHTAVGLQELPGEAMHLAGGLQFAGFPSVIATMWAVRDDDSLIVASNTYQYLFRNGLQGCDLSEVATALNHAVLLLRENPGVTLDRWAPFIHFGI
jgi:tetratricopeptide (TPR) repeat protein